MASEVNVADHESVEENTLDKVGGSDIDSEENTLDTLGGLEIDSEENTLDTLGGSEIGSEEKVPVCTYGFDIQDRLTDLILIVEDRRLCVNRVMLEVFSSVFGDLFKSKLKGKDENVVEIPDANYKEFAEFLACMYPNKQHRVSQSNVLIILPLAFHYKVEFLLDESEVLLTWVTSQTEDEEYLIRCLETARRFGLTTLRQHCFDLVVKKRKENVQTLDKEMDTDDKVAVFEELMPHLRSEVCKMKFLSSDTEQSEVLEIAHFSNAKYKKEQFNFFGKTITNLKECLTTEVWDTKFAVTVQCCHDAKFKMCPVCCDLTLTLDTTSLTNNCYVAIKFVLQNNIPGKQNMCLQKRETMTQGSQIIVPFPWYKINGLDQGFQWNDKFTVVMHILVNKPE